MPPRVSIITPVHNAAAFLDEAILSVFQQDYSAWELLLVDDGSTDGSGQLARDWCRRDARLRLLCHPYRQNRGSSASRNLAIHHARGELLALLDADDVWLPGKLRFQVNMLDAHPEAAMTFGATERWFSWNTETSEEADFVVPSFGSNTLIPPPALLQAFLENESLTPCTCATVFRRDAWEGSDAFEPCFPGLFDDQVFLAKVCLKKPVFSTGRCVARYRKHSESCCAKADRDGSHDWKRARFLAWLTDYQSSCVALP